MNHRIITSGGLHPYLWCLFLGLCLSACLFAACGKRRQLSWADISISLVLALLLGIAGSKLFYVLSRAGYMLPMYGGQAFFRDVLREFAFSGAVLGALGGLWLAAKARKRPFLRLLDTLAPAGLLMIACARFSEYFVDFGLGSYVEQPGLMFFPYAMPNAYGEWFQAVFMLEGLLALAALWVALRWKHSYVGLACLVLWALPQVFAESLRNETLRWGFVRIQQVFCVLSALAALLYAAFKARGIAPSSPNRRMTTRMLIYVLGIGICIGVEFALDKSDLSPWLCYGCMALALAAMGMAALGQIKDATAPE